jgi:membrane protease YdiL (CAAX protease family)
LSGLFVFFVLQNGWLSLFLVNMRVLPVVPWSVPLGLIWLWVFFRYFNGRWWPASTSAVRQEAMRARQLTGRQWGWCLLFFPIFLTFLTAIVNVVYRFVVIPEDDFDLSMFPWWTLYPCLVMVSINAGVSEEAGFRGYMQGGLERRLGAAAAIGVTSVVFWLAHLNHPSGSARFALLLAMSVALGALTYCAGSIWPAVVSHAALDTIFFVTGVADVAPWFFRQPTQFTETGVDGKFVFFSVLLVASGAAGAMVLRKLTALRENAAP